jgi:TRAP-type mannitol/chloroaromatic compound transport system permease small subunit
VLPSKIKEKLLERLDRLILDIRDHPCKIQKTPNSERYSDKRSISHEFKIMKILFKITKGIDTLNEWVGRGVAWITLVLVLVVFADVVMRYLFNTSFVFTQELEWHLFAFIFLIGAGYTLLHDGHVRVDIIYQRVGIKPKAWINLLGVILFLIPGCLMVIDTSLKFALTAFSIMEGSPDPGGIPFRFILKSCIPFGFTLLLLQGISLGLHSLMQIMGIESEKETS